MTGRSLRAVTFDLWDTLYVDDASASRKRRHERREVITTGLRGAGIELDAAQLFQALDASDRGANDTWVRDCRSTGARARIEGALTALGLRLPARELERIAIAVEDIALAHPAPLYERAAETIQLLADRDFQLAIISDTGQTPARVLRAWLAKDGLLGFFATTTFSDEIGQTKPAPVVFARTLELLGVAARSVAHVGDNPDTDVAGALRAGMTAVHLASKAADEHITHPDYRLAGDLDTAVNAIMEMSS